MSTASSPGPDHSHWKVLYRTAILEKNKHLLLQKVFEAERAILARRRELFSTNGTNDETEALEDALYALHAYRSALHQDDAA